MANRVPQTPALPRPAVAVPTVQALLAYDAALNTSLFKLLAEFAVRLNGALMKDGTEPMKAPAVLAPFTVLTLPDEATWAGGLIFVSDETGGPTVAYSDGTNWKRVYDNATVS